MKKPANCNIYSYPLSWLRIDSLGCYDALKSYEDAVPLYGCSLF